jgi:hypothetical protein
MSTLQIGGKEFQNAISEVMRRAAVDPHFRALAASDGNAAIAKVNPKLSGSETADVRFLDKTNTNPARVTVTLVLPDPIAKSQSAELSEAELEQVAGGGFHVSAVED